MNLLAKYTVLISITFWLNGEQYHCDCSFRLSKKMDVVFQPVYFVQTGKTFELPNPRFHENRHYIDLKEEQILVITCPNRSPPDFNVGKMRYHRKEVRYMCTDKKLVPIDDKERNDLKKTATAYQCKNPIGFSERKIDDKKTSVKRCSAKEAALYEVGIQVDFTSKHRFLSDAVDTFFISKKKQAKILLYWFPLYSICTYGMSARKIAVHTIDGQLLRHRQTKHCRHEGELITEYYGEKPRITYIKREYLRLKFTEILETKYCDLEKKNLWYTTLVPENQMLFSTLKYAVHRPYNLALMWDQVVDSWRSIENAVLSAAIRLAARLEIHTGCYKQDPPNNLVKPGKFQTNFERRPPQLFWKLVYRADTKEGIVFVLHNNPYLNKATDYSICANICAEHGWKVANNVLGMGKVYCCKVADIVAKNEEFKTFEKLVEVENVLKMPEPPLS